MGLKDYPKAVFPTLLMEFSQALAFYGTQSIFTVYMISWLQLDNSTTMAIYHTNNVLVYVFTVFGGVIADDKLGKYLTLLITSVIYSIGFAVISLTSMPPKNLAGFLSGLALVALGSAGVKPLIPAIGADQFTENQSHQKETFFGIYYMARNLGAFIGLFGVPLLRVNVECFSGDCYPVAYGIPAALMFIGTLVFIASKKLYRKIPPMGGIMTTFVGCVWPDFIEECKSVMRVLLMMTPWPFYWALYDQMGSLWIIQASDMNGEIGDVVIHPDQTSAMNSLLIVCFVPLLHQLIYPALDRFKIPNTLLQRISLGMLVTALSFLIGGLVMLFINDSNPVPIPHNKAEFRIINTLQCPVNVSLATNTFHEDFRLNVKEGSSLRETDVETVRINLSDINCMGKIFSQEMPDTRLISRNRSTIFISQAGGQLLTTTLLHPRQKFARATNSKTGVRVMNTLDQDGHVYFYHGTSAKGYIPVYNNSATPGYTEFPLGTFQMEFKSQDGSIAGLGEHKFGNGAFHTIVLQMDEHGKNTVVTYEDVNEYQVSILWIIPQFVFLSFAETLFSVNSLEFSYEQAPASMKGVMTGFFMLTIAIGNIVVTILSKIMVFRNQAITFFVYSGLECLAFVAFVLLAVFYKYVNYEIDEVISEHGDPEYQRHRTMSKSQSETMEKDLKRRKAQHDNDAFDEVTRF